MQFPYDHKQTSPAAQVVIPLPEDRRDALRLWLVASKTTYVELGKLLGMTSSAVSQTVSRERMPVRYHTRLVEYGIPPELLPRPEDVLPGPRRKDPATGQALQAAGS